MLIFKGERRTSREQESIDYLQGMPKRLEEQQSTGQEVFRLEELPAEHPARAFGRGRRAPGGG